MSRIGRRLQSASKLSVPTGPNLLVGRTFTSDVEDSTSETGPIARATDQNTGTRWISEPESPVNITADLGTVYDLTHIVIVFAGNTIRSYTVSVSTNGSTFTQIATGSTNNTTPQTVMISSFSNTPKGRYLRITGVDRWNIAFGNSIWEVEAYGSVDSSFPTGSITNFTATAVSTTQINLTWNYSGSSLTNFTLRRDGTVIANPAAGATSYNNTGLTTNTSYEYTLTGNFSAGGTTSTESDGATTQGGGGGTTIALSSSVLPAPNFPVRIDTTDNRNFIDASNNRYYGVADTGWLAMNKLSKANFTNYATKRRQQGFTMLLLSILRLETRTDSENVRTDPQFATGTLPFSNMSNLSTALTSGGDDYWDHIAWCVDECANLGLVAALVPSWYGYQGNAWRSTVASSTSNAAAYGTFLGNLLGDRENVMWLMGGDSAPGSALAATNAMANAIAAEVAPGNHQPMTYHTGRNLTTWADFGSQGWYDIHAAYSGVASGSDTNAGIRVTDEWNRGTVKPVMLVEDYYDRRGDFGASPDFSRTELRNQLWQSTLAGAFLSAHGNEHTWRFTSGWNGSNGYNAPAADVDTRIFSRVLNTYYNKRFLSDHSANIITSNRGSGTSTAHGIRSSDNTVGIVYIPANSRAITINTGLFTGNVSLAWVNPQTGAVNQFATGHSGSSYNVTSPSSTGDSVLIIQSN